MLNIVKYKQPQKLSLSGGDYIIANFGGEMAITRVTNTNTKCPFAAAGKRHCRMRTQKIPKVTFLSKIR